MRYRPALLIGPTSIQARFLIPMAISLGFGILFATLIALILIPCLYMALVDVRRLFGAVSEEGDRRQEPEEAEPQPLPVAS